MTAWDEFGRYHVKVEVDCREPLPSRALANVQAGAQGMVGANVLKVAQRLNEFVDCTCTCWCDHCSEAHLMQNVPPATLIVSAWLVAKSQSHAEKDVEAAVRDVMAGEKLVAA